MNTKNTHPICVSTTLLAPSSFSNSKILHRYTGGLIIDNTDSKDNHNDNSDDVDNVNDSNIIIINNCWDIQVYRRPSGGGAYHHSLALQFPSFVQVPPFL